MIHSGIRVSMLDDIKRLSAAIEAYPAAFAGNRLNLLFLADAHPIHSSSEFLRNIDSPFLQEERREYLLGEREGWPFPTIGVKHRPDPWQLSEALFTNFEAASNILPTQQQIGQMLADRVIRRDPDIIILNVADGLSYYDLPEDTNASPCLVRGVTTTDFGFRDVIGRPTVSHHLFSLGYKSQMAFTFFDISVQPLSAHLHSTFGSSQVNRIDSIEEGLKIIKENLFWRGYIQLVTPGLDRLSHYHADAPLIKETLNRILERFDRVIDCASSKGRKVMACLTSDHGILWRDDARDRTEVVQGLFPEDAVHPRYIKGSLARDYARTVRLESQSFTLLKAPYMTREWKHAEWGVHGGISAWESIVPIIMKENL